MLKVQGISTYYGKIQALKGISLEVKEGTIVTILGANGAGKTTTMNTISGLLHPKEGKISFQNEDITKLEPFQLVRKGIALVPEGRAILTGMTVLENLEMGAYHRNDKEVKQDLEMVMDRFPILRERKSQLGGTLSGGQQQMLAIARALMSKPKLLLLDEPSMGLAPLIVQDIFRIVKEINATGTTVLIVEQNARQALKIADYGYVLETGKVVAEGPAAQLLEDSSIKEAYLGH
ncbi:ABC-type branched-chain amino acid transport systems, ATPase component [Schinkia azotoformans MEV2011]|uniref:ABC-type branched-chain amino acid transport systems, ATPase component n=1 Tax=Schinkia azotoformans MEV2011 TaxID=1348973 RepID=A0A072NSL3_SCHAZ|nr:ABC transporter ATP-binding protein [Schinkia azotoformans]KEF36205.1 ABC-type branched-chain amino acid transport systems, ATPase component [Schinkia azotoformans MEV2011]MEC1693882.1 ABC transporter ATP-binding protein [Schinkia azotoformans]MEC1714693.1 ABC transporter ATP-binding protein [Schinkia azotoformans]MEC1724773.1 ABC transporter ATP-binding protein [Schinkia azotoformans]MEC1741132.1 ABC transporter ATP-binding protein [Schinkia azotoformans]